jgi:hypothetical protein
MRVVLSIISFLQISVDCFLGMAEMQILILFGSASSGLRFTNAGAA